MKMRRAILKPAQMRMIGRSCKAFRRIQFQLLWHVDWQISLVIVKKRCFGCLQNPIYVLLHQYLSSHSLWLIIYWRSAFCTFFKQKIYLSVHFPEFGENLFYLDSKWWIDVQSTYYIRWKLSLTVYYHLLINIIFILDSWMISFLSVHFIRL